MALVLYGATKPQSVALRSKCASQGISLKFLFSLSFRTADQMTVWEKTAQTKQAPTWERKDLAVDWYFIVLCKTSPNNAQGRLDSIPLCVESTP